ncbi:hypothetical protein SAMN04490244_108187 [Tranquillimonas rosea]|uniref:Uncharacterized protein n=1 Tax=Tranquillimonas rosea TaxID=641238 RepID=A0A1H9VXV7_9RHOB|nr:hypothetical protein SAMN04490244_108187 [Tranquillimonas rosea]
MKRNTDPQPFPSGHLPDGRVFRAVKRAIVSLFNSRSARA